MTSVDCLRCAALTRDLAEALEDARLSAEVAYEGNEREKRLERDLAQARQALQRIQWLPDEGYESVAVRNLGTAKRLAREALVERGTEQDLGGDETSPVAEEGQRERSGSREH